MQYMWKDLQNAMAWFRSAPGEWVEGEQINAKVSAQWLWEVLQGDFHDGQTTTQFVSGTAISMLPLVDQLCDVRDLVANCKRIDEDPDNPLAWVELFLVLVAVFPTLGSLSKGCLKIVFASARKGVRKSVRKGTPQTVQSQRLQATVAWQGLLLKLMAVLPIWGSLSKGMRNRVTQTVDSQLWQATAPWVERGILQLNQHIDSSAVTKTLSALKIDNIHLYLAKETRKLKSAINIEALLSVLDQLLHTFKSLAQMISRWSDAATQTRIEQLIAKMVRVRNRADPQLAALISPMQNWLEHLARRLEVQGNPSYQAMTQVMTQTTPGVEEQPQQPTPEPDWSPHIELLNAAKQKLS